jgi:hypothetical protein
MSRGLGFDRRAFFGIPKKAPWFPWLRLAQLGSQYQADLLPVVEARTVPGRFYSLERATVFREPFSWNMRRASERLSYRKRASKQPVP